MTKLYISFDGYVITHDDDKIIQTACRNIDHISEYLMHRYLLYYLGRGLKYLIDLGKTDNIIIISCFKIDLENKYDNIFEESMRIEITNKGLPMFQQYAIEQIEQLEFMNKFNSFSKALGTGEQCEP